MPEPHTRLEHSLLEDALALGLGTLMCAMAVLFLTHAGLVTGQTAGFAVLVSYVSGWSFGAIFFVVNLPFYVLGYLRLGARFTIKSFVAVALVSALADLLPGLVIFDRLDPPMAALMAGCCVGLGLIVLFRHGASLGGIGVLALVLQERTGFRAGWTQLLFDAALFAAAALVLPVGLVIWSLAGAVIANVIIGINHRTDRYVGR